MRVRRVRGRRGVYVSREGGREGVRARRVRGRRGVYVSREGGRGRYGVRGG